MSYKTLTTLACVMIYVLRTSESLNARKVVTFNADLDIAACNPFDRSNPKCETYDFRSSKIAEALAYELQYKLLADVVCLQGIYYDKDEKKIIKALNGSLPFSYSFTHDYDGHFDETKTYPTPCTNTDKPYLEQIDKCSDHHCHSKADYVEFVTCMEEICTGIKHAFKELSDKCSGCVFSGTERNVFDCLTHEYAFNPTGLVLLSKYEIQEFESIFFPHNHEIIRHGYLDTKIKTVGRVICTAMQPNMGNGYIDISTDATSYAEKNYKEAQVLVDATKSSKSAIIAGCLNSQSYLTKGNIESQFEPSMDLFKSAGYRDPISDSYEGSFAQCTLCFNNPYVDKIYRLGSKDGYILDHVLVKGSIPLNSGNSKLQGQNLYVNRVLMNEIGSQQPLSAHYGVAVDIKIILDPED